VTQALKTYDAILPTLGDEFTAKAFADAGDALRCKMLGNFGVGYNHIDVAAAHAHGVQVSNTPDVLTDATADMGTHVTGKTVGIVGMGRIGQAIARRCHFGFGMRVVFFNRSPKAIGFPAEQLESLHAVMGTADFVVVATPGGAETTHLIDADALAAMRPSGIFVNISRGEVVDEPALIAALQAEKITGAGLDVYEAEPHVPEELRALENCVLLPHLGSATVETRQAMGQMALDNIIAWSKDAVPPQAV